MRKIVKMLNPFFLLLEIYKLKIFYKNFSFDRKLIVFYNSFPNKIGTLAIKHSSFLKQMQLLKFLWYFVVRYKHEPRSFYFYHLIFFTFIFLYYWVGTILQEWFRGDGSSTNQLRVSTKCLLYGCSIWPVPNIYLFSMVHANISIHWFLTIQNWLCLICLVSQTPSSYI